MLLFREDGPTATSLWNGLSISANHGKAVQSDGPATDFENLWPDDYSTIDFVISGPGAVLSVAEDAIMSGGLVSGKEANEWEAEHLQAKKYDTVFDVVEEVEEESGEAEAIPQDTVWKPISLVEISAMDLQCYLSCAITSSTSKPNQRRER